VSNNSLERFPRVGVGGGGVLYSCTDCTCTENVSSLHVLLTFHSSHSLFPTKHLIMSPLIWRLMINLSRSVAEISKVYLHVTRTCIPTARFNKRKLNFLMLENTWVFFLNFDKHYQMVRNKAYNFFSWSRLEWKIDRKTISSMRFALGGRKTSWETTVVHRIVGMVKPFRYPNCSCPNSPHITSRLQVKRE
jgi:hypothetical protein